MYTPQKMSRRALLRLFSAVAAPLCLGACSPGVGPPVPRASSPAPTTAPPTVLPRPTSTPVPTPIPTSTVLPQATIAPSPTTVLPTPTVDLAQVKPNELGQIPILEYHVIGDQEARWERRWDHFAGDLDRFYGLGYRTVSLRDLIANRINVPAGKSPIVFTFDDSSAGQFRYIEKNGDLIVDPHCGVGILEAFFAKHPDFGRAATFFVLPGAARPNDLFDQDAYQRKKLQYLVDHGMDVGNHTYWHQNLSTVGSAEVQRQIGQAVVVLEQFLPGYTIDLFALPQGAWPKDRTLATEGSWKGMSYHNRAIMLVGANPAPSPSAVDFNPLALPRIQAIPDQLDLWLNILEHRPGARYISDGDPARVTFPSTLLNRLRQKPGTNISSMDGYSSVSVS